MADSNTTDSSSDYDYLDSNGEKGPENWADVLKKAYLDILTEIDLDLGDDYRTEVDLLRSGISRAQQMVQLAALGPELQMVIHDFAVHLVKDRDLAANFIQEIMSRLADVEEHLVSSTGQTVKMFQDRQAFSDGLLSEMHQFSESVKTSSRMEVLQRAVIGKLERFEGLVKDQHQRDRLRMKALSIELEALRGSVNSLRNRLDELEKENECLSAKARIDPLTGCHNRLALEERLSEEMGRYRRHGRVFTLLFLDLDNFKRVNDQYGHAVGDDCLRVFAKLICQNLRNEDMLARYGGEEFVAVLPETGAVQAELVAGKLRQMVEAREFLLRDQVVPITVSIGVSQVNSRDQDPLQILERSDEAMYRAKLAGRNRVVVV